MFDQHADNMDHPNEEDEAAQRKLRMRKANSFSGVPLKLSDILEEEPTSSEKIHNELDSGEIFRKSSAGDDSGYSSISVSSDPDDHERLLELQSLYHHNHHEPLNLPSTSSQPREFATPSLPYAVTSLASSNRRLLGRKRHVQPAAAELLTPTITITQPSTDMERASSSESLASHPSELKRVPSSLFYLEYEDDSVKRRRMPRTDLPSSRKYSAYAMPTYVCSSDNDSDIEEDQNVGLSSSRPKHKTLQAKDVPKDYYEDTMLKIDNIMKEFRMKDDIYCQIMKLLSFDLDQGLQRSTHQAATVKMFPTYVRSLPDGSEFGQYLALDLGGTNFRVLLINLNGSEKPTVTSKVYLISMVVMLGTGKMLFDHIAKCLSEFLDEVGFKNQKYSLGFTFSFPCYQESLSSARLVRWTKGFKCTGVENEDVVKLLNDAIQQRGDMQIECVAIINDNVGVLMAGAHSDKHCRVGLILGTGTNCCYVEHLDKVELWDGDRDEPQQMIINTEWGAFGDGGALDFVRNSFDSQLDSLSLNPGCQLFEKMISGMYMGEIVRLVLCDLMLKGLLFGGEMCEELFEPNRFYTKYISEIESDDPAGDYTNTKMVLQELDAPNYTLDDCHYVQHVCWQVSQRAAFLASAAVASIVARLDLPEVTIAVDGSLYRFHPHFKDLMNKKISQLVEPHQKFKLILAHDGSGQGAALVAAVAQKHQNKSSLTTGDNDSSCHNGH